MNPKELLLKPITAQMAKTVMEKFHYSGSYCRNSNVHIGVFHNDKCFGALSFGPSMDKRKTAPIVKGTRINEFLELNRMAFSNVLPKNSESRAISIALKMIKKAYPQIKWVISFADATQCGDGTIYRASGFHLVGIKKNTSIKMNSKGEIIVDHGQMDKKKKIGAKPLAGFQIKYIYFLHQDEKKNLTVPILPFSKIEEVGATMYKGKKTRHEHESNASTFHVEESGAIPTMSLQSAK